MLPNTLKIDCINQDKNDKADTVGLHSCEKCYVSVMPFLVPFSVTST